MIDLPLYDASLYPGREALSADANILRVGASLGLCQRDADPLGVVTRAEAAVLLHAILTRELQVDPPPVLETYPIENPNGANLNSYLLALRQVPEAAFAGVL